jgi:Bacterial archaeo-eukaryotic release factor family 3
MDATAIALQETVSVSELRGLASAAGPCITIAALLLNPAEIRTRLKNAVRAIEKDLTASERDRSIAGLLDLIRDVAGRIEASGVWGKALLILRSPDIFQGYWLRNWSRDILEVRDRFQLRPLFAAVAREQRFYLLGVSEGSVRLFDSTMFRADEVTLPRSVPRSLEAWMNARQPDHVMENRSVAGRSAGSMKGVVFGTSRDREKHNEYLHHFFKEVDGGVLTVLRDHGVPLVLAGVEEELAIYRRITRYPYLFDREIHVSADRIPVPELLNRARELLSESPSEALRKVFTGLDRQPASFDANEIPEMAYEGRVEDLLINEDVQDDQWDRAALETLRHGGRVFALRPAEMPRGAPLMAVLRH